MIDKKFKTRQDISVLVGCEYSGRVRDAFIKQGFNAVSCDIIESVVPGPHIVDDLLNVISSDFDVLIAFPPCTYISNAGVRYRKNTERLRLACDAMKFFSYLYDAPIKHICLENPIGMLSTCFAQPTQIIHPYYFGGYAKKRTGLWLKDLPLLVHSSVDTLFSKKTHGDLLPYYAPQVSGKQSAWLNNNKKDRSLLFHSIADAMAFQWSVYLDSIYIS